MRAIRMISTEIYEPRGTEAYLEEMERKGYHLDAAGKLLFYFKRTEPQDMRYRVEYWQDELPDELIAQYKDCGWEYVAETQRTSIFSEHRLAHRCPNHTIGNSAAISIAAICARRYGLIWCWLSLCLLLSPDCVYGLA